MQSGSSKSSTGDSEPAATQGNNAPGLEDENLNSTAASQAHSTQTAGSSNRARKSRTQTKWPEDKLTATGLDDQGWPTPDAMRDRFVLVCGLIARERVSINTKLEDLTLDDKNELFTVLEKKLEYSANMSTVDRNKAIKSAMDEIASLQQRLKSHLRADFVRQDELPFE